MTDKEKIIEIMRASGYGYFLTHDDVDVEEALEQTASTLIVAGIGAVKEEKFESDHYWRMWQGSLVELERAEHRAEVAERALKNALNNDTCYFCNEKIPCRCEHRDWGSDECIKSLLQQAEKELAEEI